MVMPDQILNARILVIEDDKTSRTLLLDILAGSGFNCVRSLSHAKGFMEIYKSYQPNLLILDLGLPDINGFDVMARLQKEYPDDYLSVIVISANQDDDIHLRALSSGAKDFLSKPYDRARVILRCRNLIETNLLHNAVKDQNHNLEKLVSERTQELHQTRLDLVRRLGYAAEHRDTDTGDHIIRMSRYCEVLARGLGFSDEDCELVLNTSPLHDIGKIAIPDSILLKPGPLTPAEMKVMKEHSKIGARILSGGTSPFLKMAELIALTHHERWDGLGYPYGLKGEDIPLVGRISAVCDVFDALTSDRPYKKAWTFNDAVDEIKKMSGSFFDPKVIKVFLSVLPQFRSIARDVRSGYSHLTRRKTTSVAKSISKVRATAR